MLLVKNGRVIDPASNIDAPRDVLMDGGKIAEVAAELGFSAQSNFTRFFHNQVGVAPSEYRRAASRPEETPPEKED